jgi:hypothetical protein
MPDESYLSALEFRAGALLVELDALGQRIRALRREAEMEDRKAGPLHREFSALQELLALHGRSIAPQVPEPETRPILPRPSVAQAIMLALREANVDQAIESQIVGKVVARIEGGEVDTETKEPRKMVLSTLGYLAKKGEIHRYPTGYVELAGHGSVIPMDS